ncbi:PDC sensor domain-containing protein, partial [Acinetobacter baumannii]|uniref:PDC sensor domain-containing protein n=1 Tax=Acinetobacter baumannii TaxID=470 RepID=UPI00286F55B7
VSLRSFGNDRRLDAAGLEYCVQPMESGRGFMSKPFVSRISNRKIVIVSAPVFGAGGKPAGVLTASMDLQATGFLRQISALKPGTSGYL